MMGMGVIGDARADTLVVMMIMMIMQIMQIMCRSISIHIHRMVIPHIIIAVAAIVIPHMHIDGTFITSNPCNGRAIICFIRNVTIGLAATAVTSINAQPFVLDRVSAFSYGSFEKRWSPHDCVMQYQ